MAAKTHPLTTADTLLLGGVGATSAVAAAPYVLPAVGVGTAFMSKQIMSLCETSPGFGTGLAGLINNGLNTIPGVGHTLALGGWANAAASGVIGLGGVLLGSYLERFDQPGKIPWGRILKYAAITTSILIALPSILSGLSMGLTYLGFVTGGAALASAVSGITSATFGLMGGINIASAGAGIAGLLPHLITCGAAAVPVAGALFAGKTMRHGSQAPAEAAWTSRISAQASGLQIPTR